MADSGIFLVKVTPPQVQSKAFSYIVNTLEKAVCEDGELVGVVLGCNVKNGNSPKKRKKILNNQPRKSNNDQV